MRAVGHDRNILLKPARRMSLEEALEFIAEDELVEVTPGADPPAEDSPEGARPPPGSAAGGVVTVFPFFSSPGVNASFLHTSLCNSPSRRDV